jgi:hypothetical protein
VSATSCRISEHPERQLIDQALRAGQSPLVCPALLGRNRKSLTKHRNRCLSLTEKGPDMDHDDFDINETLGERMRRRSSERAISQALGVTGDMTLEEE